jgi:uncharacterized protein
MIQHPASGLADKSPADPERGGTLMRAITLRAGLALAVLAGLTAGRAGAADKVKDFGDLFSAEAVKKANAIIAEIARAGTDLEVLAVAKMPRLKAEELDKLPKDDHKARQAFFLAWTVEEAKDAKADGIFILICNSPGHIQVIVDSATRKHFSKSQEEELGKILLDKFKETTGKKDEEAMPLRDKALLAAVEFVRDALKKK